MVSRLGSLRTRLIRTVPAVRGRALQIQLDAQREIARHLYAAFPDQLDQVEAAALVGAFVGSVSGAVQALLEEPDAASADPGEARDRLRRATETALRPWLR
jgi:hypothetical protein